MLWFWLWSLMRLLGPTFWTGLVIISEYCEKNIFGVCLKRLVPFHPHLTVTWWIVDWRRWRCGWSNTCLVDWLLHATWRRAPRSQKSFIQVNNQNNILCMWCNLSRRNLIQLLKYWNKSSDIVMEGCLHCFCQHGIILKMTKLNSTVCAWTAGHLAHRPCQMVPDSTRTYSSQSKDGASNESFVKNQSCSHQDLKLLIIHLILISDLIRDRWM